VRALLLITFLAAARISTAAGAVPSVDALLEGARKQLGAPLPPTLRVLFVGTGDATAVYQGQGWREPEPRRHQSTLILDFVGQRSALRSEQTRSDGTVSIFRNRVTREGGTNVNVVTGLAFPMSTEAARQAWTETAWQVPHYALRELSAHRDRLTVTGGRELGGLAVVAASFSPEGGLPFTVFFDVEGGALRGYEYERPFLFGPTVHRFLFKPYRQVAGLGHYPAGHVQLVGGRTFRDVDVFDVRSSADLSQHPWLAEGPASKREASTRKPAETSLVDIAPGVRLLKRIGYYNALLVDVGDACVAVVDAPAMLAAVAAVPASPAPDDLGARILQIVREKLARRVCYVVPTHHHADHSGAVRTLAAGGATVLALPGDVELMRRIAGEGATVESLTGVRNLGPVAIHPLRGGPHAADMLFAYVPSARVAFDGDALDYLLQSRTLVRYLEEHGLPVDTLYSVHSSGPTTWAEVLDEESSN
jgi:hypothetical protein